MAKDKPPINDMLILGLAALTYALNPKDLTPRDAFVAARSFMAEADAQMPLVMNVIREP